MLPRRHSSQGSFKERQSERRILRVRMVWFTRRSASFKEGENQRRHFRQSIELPIALSVEGLPAEVFGTLVNISQTGCRFRSLILIERARVAAFELKRTAKPSLLLRGRIVTRRQPTH